MSHHPVDLRVAASALFVRQPARVAGAGQHQPVLDPFHPLRVAGQPGDRPDGAGRVDEPVGVVRRLLRQRPGQVRRHRDARQVVVGQRRVADMAGDDHLVGDLTGDHVLGVGEVAVRECGVDAHLVVAVRQRVQGLLGQAESPLRLVVARAVRHPARVVRQGVQVCRAVRSAAWSPTPARCSRARAGWTRRSRRPGCRRCRRCRRPGCSTPAAPSSRALASRSAPRAPEAGRTRRRCPGWRARRRR